MPIISPPGSTPADLSLVRSDLANSTIVLPSRAAAALRFVPAAIGGIQTQGYLAPGDKGGALYARVVAEPAHPGKFQSLDGAWWELADPEVNPYQLGGKGRDRSSDEATDTQAVLNALAVVEARASAFGAQMALAGQNVLRIPAASHFRCAYGTRLVSTATGVSILGEGRTSKLGRAEIHMGGFRAEVRDLCLTDFGTYGVRFFGRQRRKGRCVGVMVRDRLYPHVWEGPGGSDRMLDCEAEKCGSGLVVFNTTGMQVVGCNFGEDVASINGKTSRRVGIQVWNAGELKLTNVSANGGNRSLHVIGSTRCAAVEMYFSQLTATLSAQTRVLPVVAVENNGSGKARFRTSRRLAYSQIADRGGRFIARTLPTAVHTVTATSGTYTRLAMGLDNLLTGTVAVAASPADTAAALAANINAIAISTQWYAFAIGADLVLRCGEPLRVVDDLVMDWDGTGAVTTGSSPIALEATAEARLGVSGSGTAGTVSSILAGTTELVSPFAWPASDAQVAAAINARSAVTGYSAHSYGGRVYVYGPRQAPGIWAPITVTGTGSVASGIVPRAFRAIPLAQASDFVVGEDISLLDSAVEDLTGFAEVVHMEDASTPCVELSVSGAYAGTVCRPNLLAVGESDVQTATGVTAYDRSALVPTDVADDWFTADVAFSTTATGTVACYQFDALFEASEQSNAINDIFETGCNYNRRRVRSAYNLPHHNCRIKNNNQVDPRAHVAYRSARIYRSGSPRGRNGVAVGADILTTGATTGVMHTGPFDDTGNVAPGMGGWEASVPRKASGRASNLPAASNRLRLYEDRASLESGSTQFAVRDGYGEMTGALRLTQAPVLNADAIRKQDLDEATVIIPSLAAVAARTIPTSVLAFYVAGYAKAGDKGDSGPWVRVSSEPTHPGKKQDASGAWFELQTMRITPQAFGAFGDSTLIVTTQITNMRDYWLSRLTGTAGDQWRRQPTIFWGTGQFRAPDVVFSSSVTGVTMIGDGEATLLDGIMINPCGYRHTYANLSLVDTRGKGAGAYYGFKFGDNTYTMRNTTISNVRVRDRWIGFWNVKMAACTISSWKIEKCFIAMHSGGNLNGNGGDSELSDFHCSNNEYGFYNRSTGELKFIGGHMYGGSYTNLLFEGDQRTNTLECYYTNVTFSNVSAFRDFTPLRIENNGSGYARAILWDNFDVASITPIDDSAGTKFNRGSLVRLAEAIFYPATTSGTITSLKANGIELLGAPVSWTSISGACTAVAAAIDAGFATHGFTTAIDAYGVVVIGPGNIDGSAQNGWPLVWTLTAGAARGRSHYKVTTSTAHNFLPGWAVEFNTASDGVWNGIEIVSWVESATSFYIDGSFPAFTGTAKVTRALRAKAGQDQCVAAGFTGVTSYNASPLVIMAIGPNWVDLGSGLYATPTPYAGNDVTGYIRLPIFGSEFIAWDYNATVNDQFINCGNVNTSLLRGTYQTSLVAQRTKVLLWCDTPVQPGLRINALEKIGLGRGRASTDAVGYGSFSLPAGIAVGWGYIGYINVTPGSGNTQPYALSGPGIIAPHAKAGLKNGMAAVLNRVQVLPDSVWLSAGAKDYYFDEFGAVLVSYTAATLPTPSLCPGRTVRVSDRNQRLYTSDGTVWRDQAGLALDAGPLLLLASSDEEAAALTPPVALYDRYTQSNGAMAGFQRTRLLADPAGTASESASFATDTYQRDGAASSFASEFGFSGRASTAWGVDSGGQSVEVAADAVRFTFDPATLARRGLLVESASQNLFRNPRFEGAVAGAASKVYPTYWGISAFSGANVYVVEKGIEKGIPYIDLRHTGTVGTTGAPQILPESTANVSVGPGPYAVTQAMRLVGGSLAGFTYFDWRVLTTVGGTTGEVITKNQASLLPILTGATDYWSARLSYAAVGPAGLTNATSRYRLQADTGTVIEATFRVYPGTMESGRGAPSSLITPAAGSTGISSRAADKGVLLATPASILREGWRGSVVIDFTPQAIDTVLNHAVLAQIDDGTDNNALVIRRHMATATIRAAVISGGVEASSGSAGVVLVGVAARVALAWRKGVVRLSLNGGAVVTLNTGWPGVLSALRAGNNVAGGAAADAILAALTHYRLPMTDAQLVAASVPGTALPSAVG